MTDYAWYAVVTFGSPDVRICCVTDDKEKAIAAASAAKGSGTCTCARVHEYQTRRMARSADIGEVRPGEGIIYEA